MCVFSLYRCIPERERERERERARARARARVRERERIIKWFTINMFFLLRETPSMKGGHKVFFLKSCKI